MGLWLLQLHEDSNPAAELQCTFSVLLPENSSFMKYKYTDGVYSHISLICVNNF